MGHTVKAPRRNVAWNTTEIAYNSTGFKRSPGRATRRKLRASTIPPKRLIPFATPFAPERTLSLQRTRSELFRILIQVATHHSHKNTAIERAAYLSKSTKFCMRYEGKALQLHKNVSTFCTLSNCSIRWHRVRLGDKLII